MYRYHVYHYFERSFFFFARNRHGKWVLVNDLHLTPSTLPYLVHPSHKNPTLDCEIRLVHNVFHFLSEYARVWHRCLANRRQRVYHNLNDAYFTTGVWSPGGFAAFSIPKLDYACFRAISPSRLCIHTWLECGLFNFHSHSIKLFYITRFNVYRFDR